MIAYHGSSTLPDGEIPRLSGSAGVFITPDLEFAKIFGRKIHKFLVEESFILDLRSERHKELILKRGLNLLLNEIELSTAGLPLAFNHATTIKSLETVRILAEELGFCGAYFHESTQLKNTISIEVWDTSILLSLDSFENLDFDRLNE